MYNPPAYFKQRFGVDDGGCSFGQRACSFFRDKEHSGTLHCIGILPAAAPQEQYAQGLREEGVKFLSHRQAVSVTIRMDFEQHYAAGSVGRTVQTKEMVLTAVERTRSRVAFDYQAFEKDFFVHRVAAVFRRRPARYGQAGNLSR